MQKTPSFQPPHINSQMCNFLPLPLQHVVTEVRQLTQADDHLIINSMLSAMAIAVQASADVLHPFTHKPIPLSLYCITVAESGARKSTVENILMAPFRHFEKMLEDVNKAHANNYELEKEVYDIRTKLLKGKLRKAVASENSDAEFSIGMSLQSHKEGKPTIPSIPHLLVSDVTQPALQKVLSAPWNALGFNTDEAGKILNGKDFSMPSFYNSLWEATPLSIERMSTGHHQVDNYRFSMNLMLQPSAFAKYIRSHGEQAKESGFFARCLFAFTHPSLSTQRPTTNILQTPNLERFTSRITVLLNSAHQRFLNGQLHERRLLALQNTTHILDFEHSKEICRVQIDSHDLPQAPQFIQRATEHALRLTGVMHAFLAGDDENTIKDDVLLAAMSMIQEYSIKYQQAVDYHEITESLIQALFIFIQQHAHLHSPLGLFATSKTLLLQRGPSKLRKKEQLDIALAILESRSLIQTQRISNGTYIIPSILQKDLQPPST
ncbi:DUF3987 domain-containing protein [Aeromonas salmonicida]|uniref:DUF3987 domain-containing protein n=1 Tax=Aeromonas salmonicida TaxID=645 RepID=UPI00279688FA|nr:DUF3987 domain-containing protein [Aeromonas salmonicida]MDQ1885326.1 DUF3987 domain-containing protein [Aeromonas salmonicida]